jgi:hypothetical protein
MDILTTSKLVDALDLSKEIRGSSSAYGTNDVTYQRDGAPAWSATSSWRGAWSRPARASCR